MAKVPPLVEKWCPSGEGPVTFTPKEFVPPPEDGMVAGTLAAILKQYQEHTGEQLHPGTCSGNCPECTGIVYATYSKETRGGEVVTVPHFRIIRAGSRQPQR